MDYKRSDITVLEGFDPIRRRPAMYIGAQEPGRSLRARLLEYVVSDIARERPRQIRVLLWREDAVTVAYDGSSLPIEPFGAPADGVSHPALYRPFMSLLMGPEPPFALFGAILNALSERLVVSTMHDGHRYRVVFSRGMLATLLKRVHCDRPLGTTWLTFRPDATIMTGEALTLGGAREIAARVGRTVDRVRIRVEDRTIEDADWS